MNPLREFAVPLRSLDPADPEVADLEFLRDLVGEARVVSIGESAHCVREFYLLKDRILRFLVSELGFTAFVMESGFPEGLAVNDWVLGGEGDLDHIAREGITYRFGECEEMRAQLQWMRDWNAAHDHKVRFYGMDVPGSCANPRPAISACLLRLERQPEDAALLTLADLGGQSEARTRYLGMDPSDRRRLSAGIAGLVERASAKGNEIAYRCALSARTLDVCAGLEFQPRGGRNERDALMADNVRWILEREGRVVVSAHNGHIQRNWSYGSSLGRMLGPFLGDEMVVIGTTYATGMVMNLHTPEGERIASPCWEELEPPAPRTIDALMDGVGLPLHFVDLRRVPTTCLAGANAMLVHHHVVDIDPKSAFDALIHIRRVAPAVGAIEASGSDLAAASRGN